MNPPLTALVSTFLVCGVTAASAVAQTVVADEPPPEGTIVLQGLPEDVRPEKWPWGITGTFDLLSPYTQIGGEPLRMDGFGYGLTWAPSGAPDTQAVTSLVQCMQEPV